MSRQCAVHHSAKREARVVLVNGGEERRRRYCLKGEGRGGRGKGTFSERWRQAKGHSTCMKWDSRGKRKKGSLKTKRQMDCSCWFFLPHLVEEASEGAWGAHFLALGGRDAEDVCEACEDARNVREICRQASLAR